MCNDVQESVFPSSEFRRTAPGEEAAAVTAEATGTGAAAATAAKAKAELNSQHEKEEELLVLKTTRQLRTSVNLKLFFLLWLSPLTLSLSSPLLLQLDKQRATFSPRIQVTRVQLLRVRISER